MPLDVIPSIAERYHVSVDAAREVERSLRATGGLQAQFSHPDLGGIGQWMPGMCMVGRVGDYQLQTRVAGLCAEVSAIVRGEGTAGTAALGRDPRTAPAAGCVGLAAGESWWPAAFGHPAAAGQQHGVRYAYFPDRRRLLVEIGSRIECYDTADHRISGVSQQQGRSSRLAFTSQLGDVPLDQLRCVPMGEEVAR
jgi:hypothetical protein